MNYTQSTELEMDESENDDSTMMSVVPNKSNSSSPTSLSTATKGSTTKKVLSEKKTSDEGPVRASQHQEEDFTQNSHSPPPRMKIPNYHSSAANVVSDICTNNLIYSGRPSSCNPLDTSSTFISSPSTSSTRSSSDSTSVSSSNRSDLVVDHHHHHHHHPRKAGEVLHEEMRGEALLIMPSSLNFPPPPPPPPPLQTGLTPFRRFRLGNCLDSASASERAYANDLEAYNLDTKTPSTRTNITFSVENILAPNKFGNNHRDLSNEDSKDHSDEDEEQGKQIRRLLSNLINFALINNYGIVLFNGCNFYCFEKGK